MSALLLSYILLQTGIAANTGGWISILLLSISLLFLIIGSIGRRNAIKGGEAALAILFLIHATFPVLTFSNPAGFFVVSYVSFAFVVALVIQIAFPSSMLQRSIFVVGICYAVVMYAVIPIISVSPPIDVFAMGQQSADRFLHGINPYSMPIEYTQLFSDQIGYSHIPGYLYLPSSLLLQTVGMLFGDIRWISIIAMFGSAWILWSIGKKHMQDKAYLLPLLFLFQTRGMYVVEFAWVEPLLLTALFLVVYSRYAGFFLGILLSLKQYLLFFVVHSILLGKRTACVGFALAAVIIIPFVLWDISAFTTSVVDFVFAMGHRTDAITISTRLGIEMPRFASLIVGGGTSLVTLCLFWNYPRPLGFLFASTITTFSMFLFGSQAFINYYIFVGGMILCTAVLTSVSHE